ncbi:hypothetical protein BTJ40_09260 [Microbulbifer sp. A4B17]|uniref:hypothetical protein n=1 Tax=Microbulbifer sp. A4B17 TaxID=359370 RepID=UPI000D52E0E7|nr:hypothetical protein [Microbulbifer sp. A4B17]AWF80984.1 hypothetical protein BTJ40_09260 [Microbulbifer sp. A4B17]
MLEFIAMSAIAGTNCHYQGPYLVKGLAYDPVDRQLQYCEYYTSKENDEIIVFYYSPEGDLIAEKTLQERDGAAASRSALPNVTQVDRRHGEVREVLWQDSQWKMRYRANEDKDWKVSLRDARSIDVIDAGFDTYVRDHWGSLASGETLNFNFASPMHGRSIKLRARMVSCNREASEDTCIRVDVAQPLIRLFVKDLNLTYDTASRRLKSFKGIVNILDSQANSQQLEVFYQYSMPPSGTLPAHP